MASEREGRGTAVPATPATVLVVDDEPGILLLATLALEEAGYRVVTARNGREALALAERAPPALVLADRMMPLLDGLGLLRALRAGPRTGRIPVALMSAVWGSGEGEADAFLRKPFDLAALEATVARLLAASGERA